MYKISYSRGENGLYIATDLKNNVFNNNIKDVANENYMDLNSFLTKYNLDLGVYSFFNIEKNDVFNTPGNLIITFGRETENIDISWVTIESNDQMVTQFTNIIDTILDDFVLEVMTERGYLLYNNEWTPDIEKLRNNALSSEKRNLMFINSIKLDINVSDFIFSCSKIEQTIIKQSISENEPLELPVVKNDEVLLQEINVNELNEISDKYLIEFNNKKNTILSKIQEIEAANDINYFINN